MTAWVRAVGLAIGGAPEEFSGGGVEGVKARMAVVRRHLAVGLQAGIHHRHIDPGALGGHTEMDAPHEAAASHFLLPQDAAIVVGVEAVNHPRFLSRHQDLPVAVDVDKEDGCGHIVVAPAVQGAVGGLEHARRRPGILGSQLAVPDPLAGAAVHGEHRVGVVVAGGRVILAAAVIDQPALGVGGGAGPDAAPGGGENGGAGAGLALFRGAALDRVMTPLDGAGGRIEGHQGAPEGAAGIGGIGRGGDFQGRHRDIENAFVEQRRAGDGGIGMVVEAHPPQHFAGDGVEGVGAAQQIAEVKPRIAGRLCPRRPGFHHRGGAHLGADVAGPAGAAAVEVEGVDSAVLAAHEQRPHGYHRLGAGAGGVREGEGPLEFEPGYLGRVEAGHLVGDETARIVAPAHGGRRAGQVEAIGLPLAGGRPRGRLVIGQVLAGQELRHLALLVAVEGRRLLAHDAVGEGVEDPLGGQRFEKFPMGRLGHGTLVAVGAVLLVEVLAGVVVRIEGRVPVEQRIRRGWLGAKRGAAKADKGRAQDQGGDGVVGHGHGLASWIVVWGCWRVTAGCRRPPGAPGR